MTDNQTEKQKVQELTDKDVGLTMMDAQKEIDALQDSETEINKSQEQHEASDARKAAQLLHGSMDKYGIYQLKKNPELDKFRFEGTESLKRMGITKYNFDTIVPENYEQVYMGELSEFRGRTQGKHWKPSIRSSILITRQTTRHILFLSVTLWYCMKTEKTAHILWIRSDLPVCHNFCMNWKKRQKILRSHLLWQNVENFMTSEHIMRIFQPLKMLSGFTGNWIRHG